MKFVGLDIGGANIKLSSTNGDAEEIAFPFWKDKTRFLEVLQGLKSKIEPEDAMGITMTAELADCFESKQDGVEYIVDAVCLAFSQNLPLFYQTDGTMRDGLNAKKNWQMTAASNWHALAWFAFQDSSQCSGIVIDIGSTTTDIIPVVDGMPEFSCQEDVQRLSNGQLFYAGVGRTPVCSLLDQVVINSSTISIAREFFATTRDALIWLGELPEDSDCSNSADGRSNSRMHCGKRLARMVCADLEDLGEAAVTSIAQSVRDSLVQGISQSLRQVVDESDLKSIECFKVFGGGAFLVNDVITKAGLELPIETTVELHSGNQLQNQTAPALAVAVKRQAVFESQLASPK